MWIHVCLCRSGEVYVHKEYLDFCHSHASLCPGNGKVWLKAILTWVMTSPKKGSRESIKLIFILKEVVEICIVPNYRIDLMSMII